MNDDKRNPGLVRGDDESSNSFRERTREVVQKLRWQSDGHRFWYTHRNPYGCWICEIVQLLEQYGQLCDNLLQADQDLLGRTDETDT